MYAESSLGHPGDKTDLKFRPFISPPRHYLVFYYNMNGGDSGELQVCIPNICERVIAPYYSPIFTGTTPHFTPSHK